MEGLNAKKSILSGMLAGSDFKLPEFVTELQGFSLGLRHEHWETTSYETHKAVEATQETLDDLIDTFVEAYTGMVGGARPIFDKSLTESRDDDKMISCLKGVALKDTSLLNIRDEMLQAIYKLKYLRSLK